MVFTDVTGSNIAKMIEIAEMGYTKSKVERSESHTSVKNQS